ncbi:MAG: hypothetical protein V1923_03800, partial [Candidatus Omnitrophota bacterium]
SEKTKIQKQGPVSSLKLSYIIKKTSQEKIKLFLIIPGLNSLRINELCIISPDVFALLSACLYGILYVEKDGVTIRANSS